MQGRPRMATEAPPRGVNDTYWVGLVNDRARKARDHYQAYFKRLARWYDLYRGLYKGNSQAFRNNMSIPFIYSVIQSDVARKVQATFGSWPIVQFVGYAPDDEAVARKNEILISAQMKDSDSFRKAYDLYLTADLYGTGILQHGWREDIAKERWRVAGENGDEQVFEGDVTRFDGPDWEVIDPMDFL